MNDELNPLYRAADDRYGTDFDTTQLRQGGHGKVVHRDYLAHCLRWGWVGRHVRHGERILDAGCGQDVSLYDVLAGTKSFQVNPKNPESRARPTYVGFDLNPIKKRTGASWAYVAGGVNIVEDGIALHLPHGADPFDLIVSFEVIEHMATVKGDEYLQELREWVADDGRMVLSTPVFNGRAAKNHIHEYAIPELEEKLDRAGWAVDERWGTFMSWQDMEKAAPSEQRVLAGQLRYYLGAEVVACLLAPLYPDAARNNVWLLRPR